MSDTAQLARDFLAALASNNPIQFEAVLSDDVGLRLHRWDGREIYRPRKRVMQRLSESGPAGPILR